MLAYPLFSVDPVSCLSGPVPKNRLDKMRGGGQQPSITPRSYSRGPHPRYLRQVSQSATKSGKCTPPPGFRFVEGGRPLQTRRLLFDFSVEHTSLNISLRVFASSVTLLILNLVKMIKANEPGTSFYCHTIKECQYISNQSHVT